MVTEKVFKRTSLEAVAVDSEEPALLSPDPVTSPPVAATHTQHHLLQTRLTRAGPQPEATAHQLL